MKLKELYNSKVVPEMMKQFGYKNVMETPSLEKIVLNVGISAKQKDADFKDVVENTLTKISGQKPVLRKAKKSISSFKIREGNIVGMSVTLRKDKMYDFVAKLVNITFPRTRDFRGISPKSFDGNGNYSIGLKDQAAFPELKPSDIDKLHGLEVIVVTTAKTDKEAKSLLELMGFPFKKL